MRRTTAFIVMALLIIIACCYIFPIPVSAQDNTPATVERLLGQSGYNYVKKTNNVWYIDFHGKNLPQYKVIITTGQDLVVIFVTVIEKRNFTASTEAQQRLLKLSYEMDRVKVGLDRDDDIFVRVDLSPRILDIQELKENIEQVASSADATYKAMMPFLTTAR